MFYHGRSHLDVFIQKQERCFCLSYLRSENPEQLALNTFMNILTALLINGLGHTRESESVNAHVLCFSSCEQQCWLLYVREAPEHSKNKLLFKRDENPDHKPIVFYIAENNPISEPNTSICMLVGSPPESTFYFKLKPETKSIHQKNVVLFIARRFCM